MGKKCIIKERFEKKYRLSELDKKLTKQRIVNESRNIARAYKNGINVPGLLFIDTINRKIYMQYIDNSVQLKEVLKVIYFSDDITKYDILIDKIITQVGENIAKLHNNDIIHGDLTTSNMLLKVSNMIGLNELNSLNVNSGLNSIISNLDFDYFYLIDFGLSYISTLIEDKAVDLYVLKRAIISANPKSEEIVI